MTRALRADAQRNRERILDVATAVVAEQGTQASLRDIARRAGVGMGTLYRHFATREELLEALLGGLAVMALMSMVSNNTFKPREALDEMSAGERLHAGLGYYAALAIHAYGLIYACDHLFRR